MCVRCEAHESRDRQLITVGDLLGMPVPLDLGDADPAMWEAAYCRSRDCAGWAARVYVRHRLNKMRLHGRGVRS